MMKPNDKAIEAALDAAYAAQFQSEDYAELVKELRKDISDPNGKLMSDWDSWRKYIASGGDSSWSRDQFEGHLGAISEIHHSAADAIEALLAERDDFAEQLALRSESGMAKDMQEIMRINNELVAERDALAARLAPVEDDELVEIVAKVLQGGYETEWSVLPEEWKKDWLRDARAAIAAIRPHIEATEREKWQKMLARMGAGTTKTGAVNE